MSAKSALKAQEQPIKKILVPVDYSDCSKYACRYAVNLACKLSAEIKLLHAYFAPSFDLIELSGTVHIQQQLKDEASANLENIERETADKFMEELTKYIAACNLGKISVSYEITAGLPEDEIIRYCNEYQPDIVLIGTHGKDKAKNIMGSVAESMIRKLEFPIMAIPENYSFVGEKNVRNLMYVTEFDEADFVSIKKLMDIISPLNLKIHCVHLAEGEGGWDKIKMNGFKDYFKNVYDKTEVVCGWINSKNLLSEFDRQVQDKNINIISITTRQRGIIDKLFRTDLTKKLFYHINIPLLIFHS